MSEAVDASMTESAGLPAKGRLLGLDVGDRWLGLAISDPDQHLAVPLRVLDRRAGDVEAAIEALVATEEVAALVVGLPLNMSGAVGPQAEKATAFGRGLAQRLGLPIALWDERLSSWEASRLAPQPSRRHRSGGRRPQRTRDDAAAAAIILQSYLDRRRAEAT